MKLLLKHIILIVLGVALIGLGCFEVVDSFWSGMGASLLAVGALRLIQAYRYRKSESYREKMDLEVNDERNRFLRNKAWAWAGYLFILISACAVIVLKVMGQELLCMAASFSVCLMLVLYWGS